MSALRFTRSRAASRSEAERPTGSPWAATWTRYGRRSRRTRRRRSTPRAPRLCCATRAAISSSQSTTRADRRRDASGTRPSYEHSVTGARGPEATDVHHPEREASDASRRVETRDVETERVSPSRASSDPPDEDVEDGSGTTFEDRSATVATEDALRRLTARDLNVLADTQSAPQTRVRASRHLREVLETRVEPALLAATAAELFLKPFLRRLGGRASDVSPARRGRARRAGARHRGVPRGGRARRRAGPAPVRRAGAARQARARRRSASLGVRRSRRGTQRLRLRFARANGPARKPSEEIRAKLHRVFRELLVNASQSSGNSLAAYASDAVLVLQFTAEDAFWEVAHEACVLLEALCHELPPFVAGGEEAGVDVRAQPDAPPVQGARRHAARAARADALRRARDDPGPVRVQTPQPRADQGVLRRGPQGELLRQARALDSCARVRLAFVETLGDWMTTLVERADHEPRALAVRSCPRRRTRPAVPTPPRRRCWRRRRAVRAEHEKDLKATGDVRARALRRRAFSRTR